MVTQVPGINISILRQSTFAKREEPLLINGRVTAFGFGVPTLVRVSLLGPDFDPQILVFDTFSAPIGGDYSISVIASKDGRYTVAAQAFLPIAIPIPGADPITIGPPLAESPTPPVVIGEPRDGGVSAELPTGRQFLSLPPPTSIEINAPVIVAPVIPITIGRPGFQFPELPDRPPDRPAEIIIIPIVEVPVVEVPTEEKEPTVSIVKGARITGFGVS